MPHKHRYEKEHRTLAIMTLAGIALTVVVAFIWISV